jgi:uncharacterized protein (TIGR03067 family)
MSATVLFVGLSMLAAGDPSPEQIKQEMARLERDWVLVSGIANGHKMPDDAVKTCRRTIKNGETTVMLKGEVFMKAKFTIDPTKKPKTIDYQVLEGKTKGSTRLGIYELDGDTLRINYAVPYRDRPTDFTSKVGAEHSVSVWKRAPKEEKK